VPVRRVDARPSWLGLRRRQLMELEDQPWWPAPWRDAGTSFLALMLKLSGHAAILAGRMQRALARSGAQRVLDMGSGGGGPMAAVAAAADPGVRFLLTDLHPNLDALRAVSEASGGRVSFSEQPVDATAVPEGLSGLRTMFNAFHHLPPDAARGVLQDAVRRGQPVAILEVISRSPLHLFALLLAPLNFALTLPLQRPVRPLNLLFTYLLPVLPAFVLWDGVVSWARIYDPDELEALVRGLEGAEGWDWEIGCFQLGRSPAWGVYLEGLPPRG
jgi:SAM-dependent methyltransferase